MGILVIQVLSNPFLVACHAMARRQIVNQRYIAVQYYFYFTANGLEDCTQKKVKTQQSGDMLHISMENMTWDEFSEYMKEIVKQVSELKLKDPTTEQSVLPNKACPDGDNAECLESEPKLKKKRSKKAKRNGKKRRKSKAKQRLLKELNSINELENIETWPVINEKSQPNPSASTNEDLVKCTASEAVSVPS